MHSIPGKQARVLHLVRTSVGSWEFKTSVFAKQGAKLCVCFPSIFSHNTFRGLTWTEFAELAVGGN